MLKRLLIALLAIGILSACGGEDKVTEEKIKKEATTFMKSMEEEPFIPQDIEYPDFPGGGLCFVNGYLESDPDTEISVTVEYNEEEDFYKAGSYTEDKVDK
ncbi:hypothetical protein [Bacillus massilinigeriensis]|uniref:hypothetical protein n=1 Tax=Bacillus mediterraneensis TaxID=1805474 RepID=UPI0008F974E5|nr:hypothetical protein [Bacillus mediterraneensis]